VAALAVAIVAGIAFVRRQSRLAMPLVDFSLFTNPALMSGVLAAAFALFAFAGLQLLMTQRFRFVAGFTPVEAGLLVSVAALGSLPTMLLGGALMHRIGLRLLIAGGLAVAALAILLATFGLAHGLGWVIAGTALAGAGVGATMSVGSTAIVTNAPVARAGMAGSVEEVSFELGSLLAVALLGSLLGAFYTAGLALPAGAPEAARDNIAAALALADAAGAEGRALRSAAASAFDEAFVTVMHAIAGIIAAGALITGAMLRRYGPGSQSSLYPH
jgi:DHA2 family multidrug resistance protein-like MFS transporter